MKKTIKQMALTYFIFVSASFLHADIYNTEEGVCAPECCAGSNCGTFSVGGDWLYWKVEQQKMHVGDNVIFTTEGSTSFLVDSNILTPKFKTTSGYRVFADYLSPCNDWKASVIYAHIPTNASVNHVGNPADSTFNFVTLIDTNFYLLDGVAGTAFNSVNARWNANINYFDFDLERRFCVCNSVDIKPHIGIRGLWINQTVKIGGSNTLVFTSTMKSRLKGIGLEGGLWGSWNMGCGFSIIGHIGGSLLYAQSRNSGSLDAVSGGITTTLNYSEKNKLSLPTVDSFIGLVYSRHCFNRLFKVQVGWENCIIFSTNQFSNSGNENMTMQGLTLGGSVSF